MSVILILTFRVFIFLNNDSNFSKSKKRNKKAKNIIDAFNMIRMLDGENYPNAYIRFGKLKLKFHNAQIKKKKLLASVKFFQNDKN